MEFNTFTASGDSKQLLLETLEFIIAKGKLNLKGFFIDRTGYLVLCSYVSEENENEKAYPFIPTPVCIVEHVFQYLSELTDEELASMGCEPSGYEEDYEIGWELFIPECGSDVYSVTDYSWGKTVLAVKPKLIEYGK